MLVAGEPSGDMLAAELVRAIKESPEIRAQPEPPRFFGAGGPEMARAGVELELDMTEHSVMGIGDVLRRYGEFRAIFKRLLRLAANRQPDAIILVDFSGFNLRFAAAIRRLTKNAGTGFQNWRPKIVNYVSPQVWASRSYRADSVARTSDLLLSIIPFEKAWYAERVPSLKVEFVGHPLIDRYPQKANPARGSAAPPLLLLLPGSRVREIATHLPIMLDAAQQVSKAQPIRVRVTLPSPKLVALAKRHTGGARSIEVHEGGLGASLAEAAAAIACSGTVTLECAWFRVPTVVIYKTSFLFYAVAKRIVQVKHIAMPNIIANEMIFPELIQEEVTVGKIVPLTTAGLFRTEYRNEISRRLDRVIAALGEPGAASRAAEAVLGIVR